MTRASLSSRLRDRGMAAARWFAFPVFPLDLRTVAGVAALAVIGFVYWWGHTMDVTGSGLDRYPTRWIRSIAFRGTVISGMIAGSCLWASWIPWRSLRISAAIVFTAATLGMFFASLETEIWFEMYASREPLPMEFHRAVHAGVTASVVGWMAALVVLAKRILVSTTAGAVRAVRAVQASVR